MKLRNHRLGLFDGRRFLVLMSILLLCSQLGLQTVFADIDPVSDVYNEADTREKMYQAIQDYSEYAMDHQKLQWITNSKKADKDALLDYMIVRRPYENRDELYTTFTNAYATRIVIMYMHKAPEQEDGASSIVDMIDTINNGIFTNPGFDLSEYNPLEPEEKRIIGQAVLDNMPADGYVTAANIQAVIDMAIYLLKNGGAQPASGLTVTSTDVVGAVNDGKTQITVAPAAATGHKLVYLNAANSVVTVPNVGETLSGYTELPEDGIVNATNGDKLAVAELDVNDKVVKFGQTAAVVEAEPVAASGLTVTSTDVVGAVNDGKTQISVTPAAATGHKLVYLNAANSVVTVPNVGETLSGYTELPEDGIVNATNGDKLAVAELDVNDKVVKFGQTTAVVEAEPVAASGLTVTSTDMAGTANDGKTQITVAPAAATGHKLVYLNAANSVVTVPNVGETLSGYTELPEDGIVNATNGDKLAVAELDVNDKVVKFGQTTAVVVAEPVAASGLTVTSTDVAGAANDGKTQISVTPAAATGHKLVYLNAANNVVTVPNVGETLSGYTELPEDGIVNATNGDKLAVAELDVNDKVVKFGQTTAVVEAEPVAASGLTVTSTDVAGATNDGKTQITVAPAAATGHKFVYLNAASGVVTVPNVGETLSGYTDLPVDGIVNAANGDKLAVAELDVNNKVVKFGQTTAVVEAEPVAASGLTVTSTDVAGATNDGKTQITVAPSAATGHKLVYLNAANSVVTVPNVGETLSGYTELPEDGIVNATNGDKLAVAELDVNNKVVKFGQTTAVVEAEPVAASGLTVTSTDVAGATNDGKTQITVAPSAATGHKFVYLNAANGVVAVPNVGETLSGYTDLPVNGILNAANGDKLAVAELDVNNKVVKFGQTTAVVEAEPVAASGLTVTSTDVAGTANDGKTQISIAPSAMPGHKFVYLNAANSVVTVPNVGETLSGYTELPEDGIVNATNGDKLAVAELDVNDKVVKFGQTTAVVEAEPVAASGLTVTSTDVAGATNDGKTQITVAPAAATGHKFVYLNAASGVVTVPNVGETLSGYTDLPVNGIVNATNGDKLAVAELDENDKVVKFGQTTAVVVAEPVAGSGLTVTSTDVAGAANDGKTQITVAPAAATGHKFVYLNAANGVVTIPNVGETLSGYTELPVNGIVNATNGDKLAVAELDVNDKVVKFGQTTAVVVAEPRSGNSGSTQPSGTSATPHSNTGVDILVNGKAETAGTATTSKRADQTVTTIVVDQKKLQAKLTSAEQRPIITIPANMKTDVIVGELNGQMIKNMENKQAVLEIKTDRAIYTLPAYQINIDSVFDQIGKSVALEDIKIQIEISATTADMVKVVQQSATKGKYELVVSPVNFTIRGTYGDRSVEINKFDAYVERKVALPDDVDPAQITTGVVIEPNGTMRHVPTKISKIDGKYFAVINSLTNSTYSVVWHPVTFSDVANHWAKDMVNDMGSRLIFEGTGGSQFNPDRDITRGEFAVILVRGLGLQMEKGATTSFSDVKSTDPYRAAIDTAHVYQLLSGFDDGTFRPNDKITREQAMVIISNAMRLTGLKTKLSGQSAEETLRSYADGAKVSEWAKNGIADSVQAGVVSGRSDDKLAPKAYMTRAEFAAIMQRLLQKSELI